ncbi:hypothetical protein C7E17_20535, partial [Stenotrophomonas maltophilia]
LFSDGFQAASSAPFKVEGSTLRATLLTLAYAAVALEADASYSAMASRPPAVRRSRWKAVPCAPPC